ncbi:MAG TPA: CoA ester lyase [Geodermatophilus sp.]|nr:CoA ester lyase [Geodermatophilus sp.]
MTAPFGPALLFCPADRPDRYDKAAQRSDTVVLDLEDAVAPAGKAAARDAVAAALPRLGPGAFVRVNAADTPWFADDVAVLRDAGHPRVVLPKATAADDLDALDGFQVLAICETAAGVLHAPGIAEHPACAAIMWGGEDLIADLGGRRSRDARGRYYPVVEHARLTVLIAAAAAGRAAVDSVHIDIGDLDGLARETTEAVDLGFAAKTCIHPSHVPVIREAFRPTEEMLAWARGVAAAAESAGGVFRHQGRMIDEPLLRQARATLARAGDAPS